MFHDLPAEQITAAIDRTAEHALWAAGALRPPVDAFALARDSGALVAEAAAGGPRARRVVLEGQRREGESVILLAPEGRRERRHWAVAHEVGESLAYRVFDELGVDPRGGPGGAREWIANRLACALLLPREWFIDAMIEGDADLFELKRKFDTASHELIARRWLEAIRGPVLVTVFDRGQMTWRRSNFRAAPPALTPEEHGTWNRSHELNRPSECYPVCHADSGTLARVRCWPIHEDGWRREILLAEVADDW